MQGSPNLAPQNAYIHMLARFTKPPAKCRYRCQHLWWGYQNPTSKLSKKQIPFQRQDEQTTVQNIWIQQEKVGQAEPTPACSTHVSVEAMAFSDHSRLSDNQIFPSVQFFSVLSSLEFHFLPNAMLLIARSGAAAKPLTDSSGVARKDVKAINVLTVQHAGGFWWHPSCSSRDTCIKTICYLNQRGPPKKHLIWQTVNPKFSR